MAEEKKLKMAEAKKSLIEIVLTSEIGKTVRLNEDGKKEIVEDKTPDGQPKFIRNDIISLQVLLNKYDTRKHDAREWPDWASIKKKAYKAFVADNEKIGDTKKIKLTLDEASFLKGFLGGFPKGEGKDAPLSDGEVMTRQTILDQLEAY